jgi:hypothetical protein
MNFSIDSMSCRMIKITIDENEKEYDIYNLHIQNNRGNQGLPYYDFERYTLFCIYMIHHN